MVRYDRGMMTEAVLALSTSGALGGAAVAVAALMVGTWLVSLVLRNASIVDITWGLGFVVVAWVSALRADAASGAASVLVAMVTVWGLRLGVYLFWRNHGNGEDYRYVAMRRRWGKRFWLISLATVFVLQGALMWIVSLPVQVAHVGDARDGALAGVALVIGLALYAIGLLFEVVGDAQLARFKADPTNEGKVMRSGLWRYTRHPNYFGDACVWWGVGIVAQAVTGTWWALLGPLVMNILLLRVSGVALLERSLRKRKPDYAEYVRTTSAFVPRPPRS
jgi:steroid 5-alpha reductase family enzyme